jgi:hypothetical protein
MGLPIEGATRDLRLDQIPIQEASIYLGLPIGFNKEECSLHGALVLTSMKESIQKLDKSKLNIAQKLEGVRFMELPRIDYRMMCADLRKSDLDKFDCWLRDQTQSWLHLKGIPHGLAGLSWRDGGFTVTFAS